MARDPLFPPTQEPDRSFERAALRPRRPPGQATAAAAPPSNVVPLSPRQRQADPQARTEGLLPPRQLRPAPRPYPLVGHDNCGNND
ncbi:MAG: hypothetical protein INF43_01825 [Alphaproteobacteria bacterium]|nr:hypothetical protein [Alphaproteobacteria bacterium]